MTGQNSPKDVSVKVEEQKPVEGVTFDRCVRETSIAMGVRGSLWYFEYLTLLASQMTTASIKASQIPRISYPRLAWQHAHPQELSRIYKIFLSEGIPSNFFRSMSSITAIGIVEHSHPRPRYTATEQAAITTGYNLVLEGSSTFYFEYNKIQKMLASQLSQPQPLLSYPPDPKRLRLISRLLTANFARVGYTGLTTNMAVLHARNWSEDPTKRAAATALATGLVQFFNMPIINAYTAINKDPTQPLGQTLSSFVRSPLADIFRAATLRAGHRSLFYTASLTGTDTWNKRVKENKPILPWTNLFAPKHPQKKADPELVNDIKATMSASVK